jgi:hypothetical protein
MTVFTAGQHVSRMDLGSMDVGLVAALSAAPLCW